MICDKIKMLRQQFGYSQGDLAKKLGIARTSVLAWESQVSVPAMKHIVALAKLFRVSTDYLLETESKRTLSLDGLSEEEINIICGLLNYFDKEEKKPKESEKTAYNKDMQAAARDRTFIERTMKCNEI